MEEKNNFFELVQIFMDNVRKEFSEKKGNKGVIYNKEIMDSLFNLLNYQITLINQIYLFNENNKVTNDNYTLDNLININKDILVTMIRKFLSVLNSSFIKVKSNEKSKINNNNIINKSINNTTFTHGKVINLLYSPVNNNNYLVSNSFAKNYSPIKKNMEKEFNSTISFTQYTPLKKFEPAFESEKNSYKFLKNKNMIYNMKNKNKNYKNIWNKLHNDNSKCDHDEKRKSKALLYQSYCKSSKDIFVDLNSNYKSNNFMGKRSINYQK